MKKNLTILSLMLGAVALLVTSSTMIRADETSVTLQETMKKAEASNLPVLIKVGTSWCSACQKFDKDTASNAELRDSIARHAVLHTVDAEKGSGTEVARSYHVDSYPTYLLTNAEGEVLDRWTGYDEPDRFLAVLAEVSKDPMTIEARVQRFRSEPTEADAAKLAKLRLSEGLYGEAHALFMRAAELNPKAKSDYCFASFQAVARGTVHNVFDLGDSKEAADRVLSTSGTSDAELLETAFLMRKVAMKANDAPAGLPYLQAAVERTANTKDEAALKMRKIALPDYALHIQKDVPRAVELQKASMGDDWTSSANKLNNFAWWCFENRINLDEAEQLARKGVELAKAGIEKANVLDTLAEICNLQGDCGDSVELIQLAIAEAPDTEYFQKQLVRFQELLAMQQD